MQTKNRLRDHTQELLIAVQKLLIEGRSLLNRAIQSAFVFPRYLLKLSLRTQVIAVLLCFLLSILLYICLFPNSTSGNILSVPTALAVWLFRKKGAVIGYSCTIIVLFASLLYLEGIGTPAKAPLTIISIVLGSRLAAVFVLLYLRTIVERADQMQEQALDAKLQMKQALEEQQQAYEQQLHLNQMKDQFLLNVNHELRTPLTELYGYLELLQIYGQQIDDEMRKTFLNRAVQGCEELQRLITHIMDAIQAGTQIQPPVIEEVGVAQTVEKLVEHLAPGRREEHELRIEIPNELLVWADPLYLRQVLRNLLSNAFKYSPPHSIIQISARIYTQIQKPGSEAEMVCISVKDNGPGIPRRELPLLFGKFVRLQRDISGNVRGTGLGLYICKQIINAMDGEIWAESEGIEGKGSCFCFTLPRVVQPGQLSI